MVTLLAAKRNAGCHTPGTTLFTVNTESISTWLCHFLAEDEVVELRAIRKDAGVEVSFFDCAHLYDRA
jgi:hypothetical protein